METSLTLEEPDLAPAKATVVEMPVFALGQTAVGDQLLYTASFAPTGEAGAWVYASDESPCPIAQVQRHHKCSVPGALTEALAKHSFEELAGPPRWSRTGIHRLMHGNEVDGRELWRGVQTFLRNFEQAGEHFYVVTALYVFLTYVYVLADVIPYLFLIGPPGTGKTMFAELLEKICFDPLLTASVTPAALARSLQFRGRTLLIDEHFSEDPLLLQSLLVGHRRSGAVTTCAPGRFLTQKLTTYGPKVLMSTEELSKPALASRVIRLETRPTARPGARVQRRHLDGQAAELRDQLYCFGLQHASSILCSYQSTPPPTGLEGRNHDLFALLLSIARVIDDLPGPALGLVATVKDFAASVVSQKRHEEHVEGEQATWARLIAELHRDGKPVPSSRKGTWWVANDLRELANKKGTLGRKFRRTKEIGEQLKGLVLDRAVIDVPDRTASALRTTRRVQCVCYQFDMTTVNQLAQASAPTAIGGEHQND